MAIKLSPLIASRVEAIASRLEAIANLRDFKEKALQVLLSGQVQVCT